MLYANASKSRRIGQGEAGVARKGGDKIRHTEEYYKRETFKTGTINDVHCSFTTVSSHNGKVF